MADNREFTVQQVERIIEAYTTQKQSLRAIAVNHQVSPPTIRRVLLDHSIKLRPRGRQPLPNSKSRRRATAQENGAISTAPAPAASPEPVVESGLFNFE